MNKTTATALIACLCFTTACDSLPDWAGSAPEVPLTGERIAVMSSINTITPDPELATDVIENDSSIAPQTATFTSIEAGQEAPEKFSVISPPIISDNKIFISDGIGSIHAYSAADLKKLWSFTAQTKDKLPGGGLAYGVGVVYAVNGWGNVIAISADSGTELWRKNLGAPIRKNPAVGEDKLLVATADNQLFALNLVDGSTIWRHSGSSEPTINYGSPIPAVKGEAVVVAYSSGEVFAISATRGAELWAETVSSGAERRNTAALFVDVSAQPLLVDGFAYVASQNGSVIAYNISNGYRIWEQKIGSVRSTPHIQGRYLFAVGDNNKIVAINRMDGRVKWVSALPKNDDKKAITTYSGPAFAGGRLYVTSSNGNLLSFDANSGKLLETSPAPTDVYARPVIHNGKLYLLNNKAELAVY